MMQCPNCGSTAQVEEISSNYSTILKTQSNSYKCGCGCLFSTREYGGYIYGEWRMQQKTNKAGDGEK